MKIIRRKFVAIGIASTLVMPAPAVHGRTRVSTAIALGADISRSVTRPRFILQKEGSTGALRHPNTIAIVEGLREPIALMFFYWATGQTVVAPWTIIRNRADMEGFCSIIDGSQRPSEEKVGYHTHLGSALDFVRDQLLEMKHMSDRLVADISGDGSNTAGVRLPDSARDQAVDAGIIINGLPIIAKTTPRQPPEGLDIYYRDKVIGGPGSFYVVANGFEDYSRSFGKKFIREVA